MQEVLFVCKFIFFFLILPILSFIFSISFKIYFANRHHASLSFIRSLTAGYAAGRGVGLGGAILIGAGAARTLRRRGCRCGVSGGGGGGGGVGRLGGGRSLAISRIVPGGLPS